MISRNFKRVQQSDQSTGPGSSAPPNRAGLSPAAMLRKHAPIILTVILFLAGIYALYHLLEPLDLKNVMASLKATPWSVLALAIGATASGYVAWIGYDWAALRFIGKRLPLPTVALGGFLGYGFGNTIGLSAVSGGAVRYRIYSGLGLDAYDVAAISSFGAIAYGVGATLIGFGALAVEPGALGQLTSTLPATIRIAALIGLVLCIAGLLAISLHGGALRLGRFSLKAPSLGDIGWQLVFTLTELSAAAFALYVLLPQGGVGYANLLVIYAIATMVGVASHVPGGVGVFESVVISAMPAGVAVNDTVTALLLFRMIYFLLPFVLALALLSAAEVWAATGRKMPQIAGLVSVLDVGRAIIPMAAGSLVLASGLFMMFAGLLPNPEATAEELETILPLALVEGGALVSSILGAFLAVLSHSIFRKSRQAFWIVLALLGLGIVLSILRAHDSERALLQIGLALILLPCRREFTRTARFARGLWSAQWLGLMLTVFVALLLTYVLVHQNSADAGAMWWQFTGATPAQRASRAGIAAAVVLSAVSLYAALGIASARSRMPERAALQEAQDILNACGSGGDMLALTGDKLLMTTETGNAVLSYGVKGASWVALGAPVGSPDGCEDLAWSFHDAARAAGARPVFYEAPESFMPRAVEMGLALHKMGEEAVIALPGFSLDGSARKKLRTTHARAERDGLAFELLRPPHSPAVMADLDEVSQDWLEAHAMREKRFSVGRFDPVWLGRWPVAVVRDKGRIIAFTNILEAEVRQSAAVDLMRHRSDAAANAMEYLFTALALHYAAKGWQELSLGMVPFAGLAGRRGSDLWTRFGALVYQRGERYYNFEGLRRFKNKFAPEWRTRYLCCRTVLPPVGPLADAARLIAGSAKGIIAK